MNATKPSYATQTHTHTYRTWNAQNSHAIWALHHWQKLVFSLIQLVSESWRFSISSKQSNNNKTEPFHLRFFFYGESFGIIFGFTRKQKPNKMQKENEREKRIRSKRRWWKKKKGSKNNILMQPHWIFCKFCRVATK